MAGAQPALGQIAWRSVGIDQLHLDDPVDVGRGRGGVQAQLEWTDEIDGLVDGRGVPRQRGPQLRRIGVLGQVERARQMQIVPRALRSGKVARAYRRRRPNFV
jgi:hypothetical protein